MTRVLVLAACLIGAVHEGGRQTPDGTTPLQLDLPDSLHLRNRAGSDGAGLCVFTSIEHAARWQNLPILLGLRDWMTKRPGGGWPEKVDRMLAALCKERRGDVPDYLQIHTGDLKLIELACNLGRMPAVTYDFSPLGRYKSRFNPSGRTAHMVNVVHCDEHWVCVLDNNFPGAAHYEWMDPATFRKVHGAKGWAIVFLAPGPPKPPRT